MKNITTTDATVNSSKNGALESKIFQLVKMKYDLQKLRIATGNRLCASFNIQLGQQPSTPQQDMPDESQKLLKKLTAEYDRITDAMIENKASVNKVIKELSEELDWVRSKLDYDLISEYVSLLEVEKRNIASMKKLVREHPLYDAFFNTEQCKGIGEETAAACIALFDVYKARHAASFWKYAGLNPVQRVNKDGDIVVEGNSKKYTEEFEYTDPKTGEVKTKRGITYNPELKTILLGVTANNIIKCCIRVEKDENKKPTGIVTYYGYAVQYRDYKNRKKQQHPDQSDGHIHNVAKRWMIRNFVRDLWVAWRTVEGLPVTVPYEQEFLGKAPHKWPNLVVYNENQANIVREEY